MAPPAGGSIAWVSRNLLVLSAVSLLQAAASELLYPILPIFLTSVLAHWWPSSAASRGSRRARLPRPSSSPGGSPIAARVVR